MLSFGTVCVEWVSVLPLGFLLKIHLSFSALVNMEKELPNALRRNHQNIPVCRHFQRGPCRLGDKCKFQHPPRFEKNSNNKQF